MQLLSLMPRSAWPATFIVVMLSLLGIAVADRRGGMSLPVRRVRTVLVAGEADDESPKEQSRIRLARARSGGALPTR